MAASAPGWGATSTRTAADGAAAAAAARATRTRLPSCSISISVRPVSSKSWVSSWINSRSTMLLGDLTIACPSLAHDPFVLSDHAPRSTLLSGAEQAGEASDRQRVALDAKSADHSLGPFCNVTLFPQPFFRFTIVTVH